MRYALISITENGQKQARKIADVLEKQPTVMKVDLYHKNVYNTLKKIFKDYDCIIGIMATGIMIRGLCNILKKKSEDPAVVVIDEHGNNVISLLSGHLGGANEIAILISNIIKANPVITTATDLNNIMGVDSLASKYGFCLKNTSPIKIINMALVDKLDVFIYLPTKYDFLEMEPSIKNNYKIKYWNDSKIMVEFEEIQLYLTPLKMVAGIGSRSGVSVKQVFLALKNALNYLGIPLKRLDAISTGEMKKDEPGIIELAWNLNLPLEIVSIDEIKHFKHPDITASNWVEKNFKIPGVAEPAALIKAGNVSHLLLRKTSLDGVSVSISIEKC
jgi:cobalt-precorrin 5A hydrolase